MIDSNARSESEVFRDLEKLCVSPGYAHVIAYFCYKDNFIIYEDEMSVGDLIPRYSKKTLTRSEISTLIGLMYKQQIDLSLPELETFKKYINETEALLHELHQSLMLPVITEINLQRQKGIPLSLSFGAALREQIFYEGESAHDFQYLDFSIKKYRKDEAWFKQNYELPIFNVPEVVNAIRKFQVRKIINCLTNMAQEPQSKWTILDGFMFTSQEIANESKSDVDIVEAVLKPFVLPTDERNDKFNNISDFNIFSAYPIILLDNSTYILFQGYTLLESLYETPFYWFMEDKFYKDIAKKNRGKFTENFTAERLKLVFGEDRIFKNIIIRKIGLRENKGEIDALVIFGDRAIILEAKSKQLTFNARKGNDKCIKNDFKKAVERAYVEQALPCAKFLNDTNYKLYDSHDNELDLLRNFKEIYILCIVSDHYPSLSSQVRQFLKVETTETITFPLVMDIFNLDTMTEMLQKPLYFLDYLNKRALYGDKISSTHEQTILSYYLNNGLCNLCINERNHMHLGNDITASLSLAMMVRRQGVEGKDTPEGILTQHQSTPISRIIEQIEQAENSDLIDIGFALLSCNYNLLKQLGDGIGKISALAQKDNKNHDVTFIVNKDTGITIHCNQDPLEIAHLKLSLDCGARKYANKARRWFGLCVEPNNLEIGLGIALDFEHEQTAEMDSVIEGFGL